MKSKTKGIQNESGYFEKINKINKSVEILIKVKENRYRYTLSCEHNYS